MSPLEKDLRDAAEALRKFGHGKHRFVGATGCLCIFGAFNYVDHGYGAALISGHSKRVKDMAEAVIEQLQQRGEWIYRFDQLSSWNDREERTPEQVLEIIEQAAGKSNSEALI